MAARVLALFHPPELLCFSLGLKQSGLSLKTVHVAAAAATRVSMGEEVGGLEAHAVVWVSLYCLDVYLFFSYSLRLGV